MRALARFLAVPMLMAGAVSVAAAENPPIPNTDIAGPTLTFDWPAIEIGVGSYEEGPTGLTVFHFPERATATVDVRGGSPATVNSDAMRLGYGSRFLDAIVFTGGSSYGEEAIAAVASWLKDNGRHGTAWDDIAFVPGAVIYDFAGHRLSEIYPDKRLARATMSTLRPGVFPLGAQGAGRAALQGSFFGCGARSGQGGAFHQQGALKIAAFTVVSAVGTLADRTGTLVRCARDPGWGDIATIADLLSLTGSRHLPDTTPSVPTRATTLSVIVVNRQMSYAALQHLAVQVHTSMARAIQPFSTQDDGDTLFAVSTQELAANAAPLSTTQLDVIAGETMWDAVLASVPALDPAPAQAAPVTLSDAALTKLAGQYRFAPHAVLDVTLHDGHLVAHLDGPGYFDLKTGSDEVLVPTGNRTFVIDGRYRTRLVFDLDAGGTARTATLDPGRWQQRGERLN